MNGNVSAKCITEEILAHVAEENITSGTLIRIIQVGFGNCCKKFSYKLNIIATATIHIKIGKIMYESKLKAMAPYISFPPLQRPFIELVICLGNVFGTSFTAKFCHGLNLKRLVSFFFLPLNAFLRIYCAVIQRVERLLCRGDHTAELGILH
jgi:hypothetical protein